MKNANGRSRKPAAFLGIDFGATKLKAVVTDRSGRALAKVVQQSIVEEGQSATLARLGIFTRRVTARIEGCGYRIVAAGVGACGLVDYANGVLIQSVVLPGWHSAPLAKVVSESLGVPTAIENDANLAILGEWWRGAARGHRVVAGLTLGTGIGGGLIIDGEVYRGGSGYGTEFGHIQVAGASPRCGCGNTGCLGRVASATATLQRYNGSLRPKQPAIMDIRELIEAARDGNRRAEGCLAQSVHYLAKASLILINCLNPNCFVFTGGMAMLGNGLLRSVRSRLDGRTYDDIARTTQLATARLGIHSGSYGAAYLALSRSKHHRAVKFRDASSTRRATHSSGG